MIDNDKEYKPVNNDIIKKCLSAFDNAIKADVIKAENKPRQARNKSGSIIVNSIDRIEESIKLQNSLCSERYYEDMYNEIIEG